MTRLRANSWFLEHIGTMKATKSSETKPRARRRANKAQHANATPWKTSATEHHKPHFRHKTTMNTYATLYAASETASGQATPLPAFELVQRIETRSTRSSRRNVEGTTGLRQPLEYFWPKLPPRPTFSSSAGHVDRVQKYPWPVDVTEAGSRTSIR